MKISVAYNLRTDKQDANAKLLTKEEIERICSAIRSLGHTVTPVEVSGNTDEIAERILNSKPRLIMNLAPGTVDGSQNTFYPDIYEKLGIPFTGGDSAFLHINQDKNRSKELLATHGIRVPKGTVISKKDQDLPDEIDYPVIIKPNLESSSKGISQESVAESKKEAEERVREILDDFTGGLLIEEFIPGRELCVPSLESFPGKILSVVEYTFKEKQDEKVKYNIFDYDMKQEGNSAKIVTPECPAALSALEKNAVTEMSEKVFDIMKCPDMGRVDIRLHENGTPYFIELNPIPSLHPKASLIIAAQSQNLELRDVMRLIIRSASDRWQID
ncbi:MAG: ATP-grasp domain-containing protein [Fidelibacterota bacterium]